MALDGDQLPSQPPLIKNNASKGDSRMTVNGMQTLLGAVTHGQSIKKQKTSTEVQKVTFTANNKLLKKANKKVIARLLKERMKVMRMNTQVGQMMQAAQEGGGSSVKRNPSHLLKSNRVSGIFLNTPGQFFVHQTTVQYDPVSLYLLTWNNPLRKGIVWVIEWKIFDGFVILMIILNSLTIAMTDLKDRQSRTMWNQMLDQLQYLFTAVFSVEAILKILGMGFIMHERSYLRDPWNWLDFLTVFIGWIEYLPSIPRLRYFRALRVLRPLRSIRAIPGLRRLINSLLRSLKLLANVVTFLVFFGIFFSIVGVNIFKGNEFNRCYLTEKPINGQWLIDPNQDRLCGLSSSGYNCLPGTFCRNPVEFNVDYSETSKDSVIMYGMSSFSNLAVALATIFQILTLEGWTQMMYNMQDAGNPVQSPLYFVFIVIFGSFYLLNLILAVIKDSFEKVDKEMDLEQLKNEFRQVELNAQQSMLNSFKGQLSRMSNNKGWDNVDETARPSNIENDAEGASPAQPFESEDEGEKEPEEVDHEIEVHDDSIYTDQFIDQEGGQQWSPPKLMEEPNDPSPFAQERDALVDSGVSPSLQKEVSQIANVQGRDDSFMAKGDKKIAFMGQAEEDESKTQLIKLRTIVVEENLTFNDEELAELEYRSYQNCFYRLCFKLARNQMVVFFILLVIMANTIVLFMDRYPIDDVDMNNMELTNQIFFVVFLLEMVIKLVGYGPRNYIRDNYNKFDLLVILFSSIDIVLTSNDSAKIQNALKAFRALRFLRIFKIARQWRSFQQILKKMQKSFRDMLNFVILLTLFIFIYALLGMELYANLVKFDANGNPVDCDETDLSVCSAKGQSSRANFDSLDQAMTTVFIVIVGDGWTQIMGDYSRATSRSSMTYFITLEIFGNIIMLNLFQAILLRQFEDKTGDEMGQSEYKKIWRSIYSKSTHISMKVSNWFLDKTCLRVLREKKKALDESDDALGASHHDAQVYHDEKNDMFALTMRNPENNPEQAAKHGGKLAVTVKVEDALFKDDPLLDQTARELIEKDLDQSSNNVARSSDEGAILARTSSEGKGGKLNKTEKVNAKKIEMYGSLRELEKFGEGGDEDLKDTVKVDHQLEKMKIAEEDMISVKPKSKPAIPLSARRKSVTMAVSRSQSQSESLLKILEGNSLYVFGPTNLFRRLCHAMHANKYFKFIIFALIIGSTINLALVEPLSDPDSEYNQTIQQIDLIFSIIFAVECALKIISKGFILNGPKSYLLKSWNVLDISVVVLSLVSFISTSNIKITKILRNFRVVRPLRLIPKNQGLKIAVQSLINSIKGIINVTIMTFFIIFVYGIFGVNFFKGLNFNCYQDHIALNPQFTLMLEPVETKWDCINTAGEWVKRKNTFDNVFYAALTLFQISTGEGWVEVMQQVVDSQGIDLVKVKNTQLSNSIYFIVFVLMIGIFSLNLFQGVVISTYLNEKEKLSNNQELTEMQREWVKVQIKCMKTKPKVTIPNVKSVHRRKLIYLSNSRRFEYVIFVCIFLNTIILALNWYGMPPEMEAVLGYLNHVFTLVFSVEAIVKIAGYGFVYFKKFWNMFDFLILVCTIVQIINSVVSIRNDLILYATVLRVLKLLKMTRFLKKGGTGFKNILKTLVVTLPNLANIALLLFLLLIFYAITGMNVFGRVMLHGELSQKANFQTFINALLTVIRCMTGEAWNDIMVALMDQRSITNQCIDYPSYEDILANKGEGVACGSYWASLFFFISFQIFVCQIFLNLFIAIILDGFDDSKQDQELRIDDAFIKTFKEAWAIQDPEGRGFIDLRQLENVFEDLIISKTNWVKGGEVLLMNQKLLYRLIRYLELPMYDQYKYFNFNDVLCRLSDSIFQVDFEKFIIDQHESMRLAERQVEVRKQIAIQKLLIASNKDNGMSMAVQDGQRTDAASSKEASEKHINDLYQSQANIAAMAEQHNQAMMKWMEKGDHLRFENFYEFKIDLEEKCRDKSKKIQLNEDLEALKRIQNTQNIFKGHFRDFCDSRIIYIRPILKKWVQASVLALRIRKGVVKLTAENQVILNMHQRFKNIIPQRQEYVVEQLVRKREDFFQILAKTLKEEERREKERLLALKKSEQRSFLTRKNQNINIKSFIPGVGIKGEKAAEPDSSKSKQGNKKAAFPGGVTRPRKLTNDMNVTPSPSSARWQPPSDWAPQIALRQAGNSSSFGKSNLASGKVKIHNDQEAAYNQVNFIKKQASNILKRLESDKTVSISQEPKETLDVRGDAVKTSNHLMIDDAMLDRLELSILKQGSATSKQEAQHQVLKHSVIQDYEELIGEGEQNHLSFEPVGSPRQQQKK